MSFSANEIDHAFKLAGFHFGRPTANSNSLELLYPNSLDVLLGLFSDYVIENMTERIGDTTGKQWYLAAELLEYLLGAGYTTDGRRLDLVNLNQGGMSYAYTPEQQHRADMARRIRQLRNTAIAMNDVAAAFPSHTHSGNELPSYVEIAAALNLLTGGNRLDYNSLQHLPTLFSGAYADLTGKPAIPPADTQAQIDVFGIVDGLFDGDSITRTTVIAVSNAVGETAISNDNPETYGVVDGLIIDIDSDGELLNNVRPGQLVNWETPTARLTGIVRGNDLTGSGVNQTRFIWVEIIYRRGLNQYKQPSVYGETATITFGLDIDDIVTSINEIRMGLPIGNVIANTQLQSASEILLRPFTFTTLGELVEWHDEHHTGIHAISGLVYNTSSAVTDAGDINVSGGLVTINPANDTQKSSILDKLVAGRQVSVKLTDSVYVEGYINSAPSQLLGKINFNLDNALVGGEAAQWVGVPTNNHAVTLNIPSNIPARSEFADVAFSGAYADLTGKPALFSGAYADLTGKPALFSGAYADLTGKPVQPSITTVTTGIATESSGNWTDILTGLANDDFLEISNIIIESSESRWATGQAKFGDIPASRVFLPDNPNQGDRIQYRRNGDKLQGQYAGSGFTYVVTIRKW